MQRRQQLATPAAARCAAMLSNISALASVGCQRTAGKIASEVSRMLAAAAGDFEHEALARQDASYHFQDRLAVARDVGEIEAPIGCFGQSRFTFFQMIGWRP